jgi:glycosyltransferase involved in cell wall biosynthesis
VTVVDVVMPARDEAPTVAANVEAASACGCVREVIVVDDGSSDATAERAAAAGAKVLRRDGEGNRGSKALAMAIGVGASDADAILFVDADCTGLTAAHLDAVCEPFLAGRATMSVGMFDYGPLRSALVRRLPPLSGERILPRWVFESVPPHKLRGYTIELRLDEVVVDHGGRTAVRTMQGVRHRTKRDKHGLVDGVRGTLAMYRDLALELRPLGDIPWASYARHLRQLDIER